MVKIELRADYWEVVLGLYERVTTLYLLLVVFYHFRATLLTKVQFVFNIFFIIIHIFIEQRKIIMYIFAVQMKKNTLQYVER